MRRAVALAALALTGCGGANAAKPAPAPPSRAAEPDVSRTLRPARDPAPGDLVTGAGPVYRGSYGQRQIQVTTFRVAR